MARCTQHMGRSGGVELEFVSLCLFALPQRVGRACPAIDGSRPFARGGVNAAHFSRGIALGASDRPAPDSLGRAIAPAFRTPAPGLDALALVQDGRIGEAILLAIDQIGEGLRGNLPLVTQGLSLLRSVGLEDAARRTALELMLLERRG